MSIVVLADHRETRSGIPARLIEMGIPVEMTVLPAGDFLIGGELLIERKTSADLDQSIRSGRLFEQTQRAAAAIERVALIVEMGDGRGLPDVSRIGAFVKLWRQLGVSLIMLRDAEQTALWIARCYHQLLKDDNAPRSRAVIGPAHRKLRLSSDEVLQGMIELIPGVGPQAARAVVECYESIESLLAASVKDLQTVPGVGRIRALRIHSQLRYRLGEDAIDDLI